jgi:hypothetical protein
MLVALGVERACLHAAVLVSMGYNGVRGISTCRDLVRDLEQAVHV